MQKMCKRFMKKIMVGLLLLLFTTMAVGCAEKAKEKEVISDVDVDVDTEIDTDVESENTDVEKDKTDEISGEETEDEAEENTSREDENSSEIEENEFSTVTPGDNIYCDVFGNEITDEVWERYFNSVDSSYMMANGVEYMLVEVDAGAGSRYFSLVWLLENGSDWGMVNANPFMYQGGRTTWIEFVEDDTIGFISISDGASGKLYRTDDAGETFVEISWPNFEAYHEENVLYNPFDVPKDVYVQDGKLYLVVGQGLDGNYFDNEIGYCDGVFVSEDDGINWQYVTVRSAERSTSEDYESLGGFYESFE